MKTNAISLFPLALAALLFSACRSHNSAILRSFEEITSAKSQEGSRFDQFHAASVNGLLPFHQVGETYFFGGERGVLTAIGISSITNPAPPVNLATSAPATNEVTYRLVRDYPSDATMEDLFRIRTNLVALSTCYVELLRKRAELLQSTTNSDPRPELQNGLRTASSNALTRLTALATAISKKNVLVFQWDATVSKSIFVRVGDLFRTSSSKLKSLRGFALVAGVRTSTLHVGPDLIQDITAQMQKYTPTVQKKIVVPTFAISAQHILYLAQEDIVKEIEALLKASYSQMTHGAELVKSLDKIELTYLAQQLQALSNTGYIEGPSSQTVEVVPMRYSIDRYTNALNANTNWTTFYSVITRAKDIEKVYQPTKNVSASTCPCR